MLEEKRRGKGCWFSGVPDGEASRLLYLNVYPSHRGIAPALHHHHSSLHSLDLGVDMGKLHVVLFVSEMRWKQAACRRRRTVGLSENTCQGMPFSKSGFFHCSCGWIETTDDQCIACVEQKD